MSAQKTDRIVRRTKKVSSKKPRQKRSLRQWFFLLCVAVFCGVLVFIFLCSDLVRIVHVHVEGVDRVSADAVSRVVQEQLSGMKFACVQNDNYFFINEKAIREKVSEDQRIQSIDIARTFPDTITLSITEYDTVPVWCIGSIHGTCFVLNTEGYTMQKTDVQSSRVQDNKHFIIVDHGHAVVEKNQRVISAEDLHKIQVLGEELIYAFTVGIVQPYVIDFRGSDEVRFETDEGWSILVDVGHDTDEILQVARLFTQKVELQSLRSDLAYVDLRFPEKMFYKMRDGVEKKDEEKSEDDE